MTIISNNTEKICLKEFTFNHKIIYSYHKKQISNKTFNLLMKQYLAIQNNDCEICITNILIICL
jgi:hypothetical protein